MRRPWPNRDCYFQDALSAVEVIYLRLMSDKIAVNDLDILLRSGLVEGVGHSGVGLKRLTEEGRGNVFSVLSVVATVRNLCSNF
jgi:hypothetical protein